MSTLLMSLLACTTTTPEARTMPPRAACFTLKAEVPEDCLAMALEARSDKDAEAATFGLTYACDGGLQEACEAATTLPGIGVERYDASLVVATACLHEHRKPACRAYLALLEGDPKATPKLIQRARSIVAGPSSAPSSPPPTPASRAAHGGE